MSTIKKVLVSTIIFLIVINNFWFGLEAFSSFSIVLLVFSLVSNLATKSNTVFLIIVTYLNLWLLWGNLTYHIFSSIWTIDGDLELVNELYSVFIFIFSLLGFFFVKNTDQFFSKNNHSITWDFSLRKALIVVKLFIFIHLLFFLPNISYGVQENYSDFSQNIALRVPFINRLIYIYPLFLIISYLRLQRLEISFYKFISILFFVSVILSLTGSRFLLMTTFVSLYFIYFVFSRNGQNKLDSKYLIYFSFFLLVIYLVIPLIRTDSSAKLNSNEIDNNLFVLFSKFGGEFRDGVWSTYSLTENNKRSISGNYVETLIFPLLPKPFISLIGLDYDVVFEETSSVIMATSIDSAVKGIRIGGVLELYYWRGYVGVALGSLILFIISNFAINNLYRKRTTSSLIVNSYILILPFYFSFSQSNLLFTPLVSFSFLFLIIYILSRSNNEKNSFS